MSEQNTDIGAQGAPEPERNVDDTQESPAARPDADQSDTDQAKGVKGMHPKSGQEN